MRCGALLGAALCVVRVAGAQSSPRACPDSVPESSLRRNVMTLVSEQADSASAQGQIAQAAIDLYAQSVAQQLRRMVGRSDSVLAAGEPRVAWSSGGAVRVTARRGRTIERSVIETDDISVPATDTKLGALIAAAIDSLNAAGEGIAWTNDLTSDSLAFELRVIGFLDENTPLFVPRALRLAFPVFTLGLPILEPVRQGSSSLGPHYPQGMRERGQEGRVVARFIVDANGRFRSGSFRDVTAESMRLAPGMFGPSHEQFVSAVRQALPRMSFQPARVGHCPVAQLVQEPFEFSLTHDDELTTVMPRGGRRPW